MNTIFINIVLKYFGRIILFVLPESAAVQHAHWHPPALAQPLCGLSLSVPELPSAPQFQPPWDRSYGPPWQPAPSGRPLLWQHHQGAVGHPNINMKTEYLTTGYKCNYILYVLLYISFLSNLQLSLNIPQLLLGLSSLAVGMTQLNLHLIQISLHLLLDSQGIIPAPDLRVQCALHGVNDPLAVPLDLLHLLILLSYLPVNLTLNLVELQLHTQNLGLLMLQSALNYKTMLEYLIERTFNFIIKNLQLHENVYFIITSASSRAVWISVFSVSTCFLDFSSSWMLFPVSPICSVRSEISSVERVTYCYCYQFNWLNIKAIYVVIFENAHAKINNWTHVGGSCFHASGSPADPELLHMSSSSWKAQCWENEPLSEIPQALPGPPHISASTLPGPDHYRGEKCFSLVNANVQLSWNSNISISTHLVKVPLLLVKVGSQSIGPLHINHEVLHLTLESLFGLLQRGTLGIHSLNLFLSFLKALGKLFPVKEQHS